MDFFKELSWLNFIVILQNIPWQSIIVMKFTVKS